MGDVDLVLALRRVEVIAEATVRARGRLEPRAARHYWDHVAALARVRPELAVLAQSSAR